MSTKQHTQQENQKQPRKQEVTAETIPNELTYSAAPLRQLGALPPVLPAHKTTRALRQAAVLQRQRQLGNQHVQRHLATKVGNSLSRAGNGLARQEEEDEKPLLNPAVLVVEQELEGHPMAVGDVVQRQPAGANSNSATITIVENPPNIVRKPEREIAASRGRAGIAGFTKGRLRTSPTPPSAHAITITFTLTFDMELAEEYSGDVLAVLQDHEMGHVNVARRVAENLKDNLKYGLEALPDFTAENEVAAANLVKQVTQDFVEQTKEEDDAYDAQDYPRMTQAYLGAKTPLADLEARYPGIANVASSIRGLIAAFDLGTLIQEMAVEVNAAAAGLSLDDLHKLQYNKEFKNLVATCRYKVKQMLEWENLIGPYLAGVLHDVETTLASFTWSAPA